MSMRRLTPFASISLLFLSFLLITRVYAQPRRALTLNVRDFGAVGDGKTKDTAAIQRALDRCWALGGCEVLLPAGEYLTGALALRSNTTLRMERGAALFGSPDGTHNVTGSGLKGAATIEPPKPPDPVPTPSKPYRLR